MPAIMDYLSCPEHLANICGVPQWKMPHWSFALQGTGIVSELCPQGARAGLK
jgi:hypothetical protein